MDVYPGVEREDEMVAAFDFCLHGKGGAAPSIDTAMHGLVDAAHVDHLHPDSGIALATAADGEKLTEACFGDRVAWVPWRRPGFQLGLDIAAIKAENPQAIGVILGGHGITAWGDDERGGGGELAGDHPHRAGVPRRARAARSRSARSCPATSRCRRRSAGPRPRRSSRRSAGSPRRTARRWVTSPTATSVLEFLSREKLAPLAELGTSCPDHFLRTKVKPLVVDLPATASVEEILARLPELHAAYRADYQGYYDRNATPDSPAMRGADPAIVLVPGVGMFSFGKDKQTARVAGEFYVNAINVMRGAESVSTYAPISEAEKFRIEYWALEEAKLARMPQPKPLATRIALVDRRGVGDRQGHRGADRGRGRLRRRRRPQPGQRRSRSPRSWVAPDRAVAVKVDVSDEDAVAQALAAGVLAFGGVDLVVNNAGLSMSKPLLETTVADWDLQHDVMAKGSFLVSREAARVMIAQDLGGDVVYISSKNSLFAGPNNIAYSATKADQAHQVRLLAAELGSHGIRPPPEPRGPRGKGAARLRGDDGAPAARLAVARGPARPPGARDAARVRRRRAATRARPRPRVARGRGSEGGDARGLIGVAARASC